MRNDDNKVEIALKEYHIRFPDQCGEQSGSGKNRIRVPAMVTFQVLEHLIASTQALWG